MDCQVLSTHRYPKLFTHVSRGQHDHYRYVSPLLGRGQCLSLAYRGFLWSISSWRTLGNNLQLWGLTQRAAYGTATKFFRGLSMSKQKAGSSDRVVAVTMAQSHTATGVS